MIWLVVYFVGFIGTALLLDFGLKVAPKTITNTLVPWHGVIAAAIWPVFWVIVGFILRDEKKDV